MSKFYKNIKKINFYPPYLGAGIKLKHVNEDLTRMEVELRSTWYNRNLFGTHFGGSLYAMCDPFYVFIIHNYLGKDYIVWDQSACIKFVKPGKGRVKAVFEVEADVLAKIKKEVDEAGKKIYQFETVITNSEGEEVAEVKKDIYVRKKQKKAT